MTLKSQYVRLPAFLTAAYRLYLYSFCVFMATEITSIAPYLGIGMLPPQLKPQLLSYETPLFAFYAFLCDPQVFYVKRTG